VARLDIAAEGPAAPPYAVSHSLVGGGSNHPVDGPVDLRIIRCDPCPLPGRALILAGSLVFDIRVNSQVRESPDSAVSTRIS
jgi:hypothetical protein